MSLADQGIRTHEIKPWSSQADDLKLVTCFLGRCWELLGQGNDWVTQCQDNVTESWCWQPGLPMGYVARELRNIQASLHIFFV